MEVISSRLHISEKLEIGAAICCRGSGQENGLTPSSARCRCGLRAIITDYTREAGVRNLERAIGSVFRMRRPRARERSRHVGSMSGSR